MARKPNPAVSSAQYGLAQRVLQGKAFNFPKKVAKELISRTSPEMRKKFARETSSRRGTYGNQNPIPNAAGGAYTFKTKGEAEEEVKRLQGEGFYASVGRRAGEDGWRVRYAAKNPSDRYTLSIYDVGRFESLGDQTFNKIQDLRDALKALKESGYTIVQHYTLKRGKWHKIEVREKRQNPGKKIKNTSESLTKATLLSEGFHGRSPAYIEEILETHRYRKNLAHLGDLIELEVVCRDGKGVIPIGFVEDDQTPPDEQDPEGHVSVSATPNRKQIIFGGGDQSLDLYEPSLDISDSEREKDLIEIGDVFSISYWTDKHHLTGPKSQANGAPYIHKFGEVSGARPVLIYDSLNKSLLLVGGEYEVRDEGIWN